MKGFEVTYFFRSSMNRSGSKSCARNSAGYQMLPRRMKSAYLWDPKDLCDDAYPRENTKPYKLMSQCVRDAVKSTYCVPAGTKKGFEPSLLGRTVSLIAVRTSIGLKGKRSIIPLTGRMQIVTNTGGYTRRSSASIQSDNTQADDGRRVAPLIKARRYFMA